MEVKSQEAVLIKENKWQRLGARFAADGAAALTAAIVVSPIMIVIDKAVVEAASGHTSLLQSMRDTLSASIFKPKTVYAQRTFTAMMLLYTGTYLTANCIDTLSAEANNEPASTTTASWSKFATVASVNMGLSIHKDSAFAQAFGSCTPANAIRRPLTAATYAPFVLRDAITILASFNVPPILASRLPESLDAYMSRLFVAQMIAPAGSQLFATPLHLLGLDFYYRNDCLPWRDRWVFLRKAWLGSSLARMCRIIPAYGLGGVINTGSRSALLEYVE